MLKIRKDAPITAGDGKTQGKTTGGGYHCRLEGCRGWRIGVRWGDGTITFPCSKGMALLTNRRSGAVVKGKIVP